MATTEGKRTQYLEMVGKDWDRVPLAAPWNKMEETVS